MSTKGKTAEKKQEKIDRKAAGEILSGLNDFLSLLNDVSNETGFEIPVHHDVNLHQLHADLMKKHLGE